jgi:hypothetical protein
VEGLAVGTIVAKNFISFARVLGRSLRAQHPEVSFVVALADRTDDMFDTSAEPFEIVPLEALGISELRHACFRNSRLQMSILAKPYLLSHMLDRGCNHAIFLDADILVLGALDGLFDATASHAIVLTPHLAEPLDGIDRIDRELNILVSGVYNGGFIGVSARPAARKFLEWFKNVLHEYCHHDTRGGMHYDQRWLDLVPCLFDDVRIVRNSSYNIAHWNLPERNAERSPRFFHFSGFEPEHPERLTRYARRLTKGTVGQFDGLFDRYAQLLRDEGYETTKNWPYAFDWFDNGVHIPVVARLLYQDLDAAAAAAFGDPFQAGDTSSFYRWLLEAGPLNGAGHSRIPRLWQAVYQSRADLQNAFPDIDGVDRDTFLDWTIACGLREHDIPDAFASAGHVRLDRAAEHAS